MHLIIWEYRVKPQSIADFTRIYAADGAWAKLFQQSAGYLGTELLVDEGNPNQFITIDRWRSIEAYKNFKDKFHAEYQKLDADCEGMTDQERLIGRYVPTA